MPRRGHKDGEKGRVRARDGERERENERGRASGVTTDPRRTRRRRRRTRHSLLCIQGSAPTSTTSPSPGSSPVQLWSSSGPASPHHPSHEVGPRLRMGKHTEQNNPSLGGQRGTGNGGDMECGSVGVWESGCVGGRRRYESSLTRSSSRPNKPVCHRQPAPCT